MNNFKTLDSKPSSMWYTQHCFDLHRKKIEGIKSRPKQTFSASMILQKSQSMPRIPVSRQVEIQRENEILLRKIVDISAGKLTSPLSSSSLRSDASMPNSLNDITRKREMQRIQSENRAMLERLVVEKPVLSVKRLEADFKRMKGYRDMFQATNARTKAAAKKAKMGKTGKLPAVQKEGKAGAQTERTEREHDEKRNSE